MIQFNQYFKEDYRYTPFDLRYQRVETEIDDSISPDLLIKDSFTVERYDEHLVVLYTRQVGFEPSSMYSINTVFKLLFDRVEGKSIDKISDDEIITSLTSDMADSLAEISSKMSLIIAELTSMSPQGPIIVPPIVLLNNRAK